MEMLVLEPALKDYIWGGRKLMDQFHKVTDMDRVAEMWELSSHPDGPSRIVNSSYRGLNFGEYLAQEKENVIGVGASSGKQFPILIKLIDAKQALSIQVHPDDVYAKQNGLGAGKNEMWYILDCDPGAYLYYGLARDVSKEEFSERIKNNTILDVLNKVYVKPGDVYYIPAGTIHAIGAGIRICEIQQNSNTTYRIYDYNRLGKDGKPRELHIEQALEVIHFQKQEENITNQIWRNMNGYAIRELIHCPYFNTRLVQISDQYSIQVKRDSFRSYIVLEGEVRVSTLNQDEVLKAGDSLFIPAGLGKIKLCNQAILMETMLPNVLA